MFWVIAAIIVSGSPAKPVDVVPLTPKPIAVWLEKLADCESLNNPNATNPQDGGSASYGYLQWKISSFYNYNLKYKIVPDLEKLEVDNVIMDKDIQLKLAEKVLQEPRGWTNWYNCGKMIGLDHAFP